MSQGYSGVEGNVLSGANDTDTQGWNGDWEINEWDSTTTADGGWDDQNASTQKFTGSFDILYNPAKTPFGALGLAPGSTPVLKLFVNKTDDKYFMGTALIGKGSVKSKTKEGFLVTISFKNKGPWVPPA